MTSARYDPCRSGVSVEWNWVRTLGTVYGVAMAEPPEL